MQACMCAVRRVGEKAADELKGLLVAERIGGRQVEASCL